MKRTNYFVLLCTFVALSILKGEVLAQNNRADSLLSLIEKTNPENNKPAFAKLLYDLGNEILLTEKTGNALDALEKSALIYRSLGDSIHYAECLYKISYLYNLTGEYSKSFK